MADEHDLVRSLQERRHDLPRDFGPLPLVGRRERFVEKNQRTGLQVVDDRVHASELLVELAALHPRVLLALEVGEETVHDAEAELCRRREHAALRHQLREPEASQKRRLSPLIGARDNDQGLAVSCDIVADRALVCTQREANVVELAAREPEGLRFARVGKAERRLQFEKLFMEIETADVERQLGLQHLKEASICSALLARASAASPRPRSLSSDMARAPASSLGAR